MTTNPLTELIPAKYRAVVYGVAALAALVFGVWQASEGDVSVFVASLLAALTSSLALSNTPDRPKLARRRRRHRA